MDCLQSVQSKLATEIKRELLSSVTWKLLGVVEYMRLESGQYIVGALCYCSEYCSVTIRVSQELEGLCMDNDAINVYLMNYIVYYT